MAAALLPADRDPRAQRRSSTRRREPPLPSLSTRRLVASHGQSTSRSIGGWAVSCASRRSRFSVARSAHTDRAERSAAITFRRASMARRRVVLPAGHHRSLPGVVLPIAQAVAADASPATDETSRCYQRARIPDARYAFLFHRAEPRTSGRTGHHCALWSSVGKKVEILRAPVEQPGCRPSTLWCRRFSPRRQIPRPR